MDLFLDPGDYQAPKDTEVERTDGVFTSTEPSTSFPFPEYGIADLGATGVFGL